MTIQDVIDKKELSFIPFETTNGEFSYLLGLALKYRFNCLDKEQAIEFYKNSIRKAWIVVSKDIRCGVVFISSYNTENSKVFTVSGFGDSNAVGKVDCGLSVMQKVTEFASEYVLDNFSDSVFTIVDDRNKSAKRNALKSGFTFIQPIIRKDGQIINLYRRMK